MRDIFARPLAQPELRELAAIVTADELFSWRSPAARELAPLRGSLSDERLIELMAGEPRLIRRPVTRYGDLVIVGFDQDRLGRLTP